MMDKAPFYSTRIDSPDLGIDVLARFHKAVFSPTAIRDYATELIYLERIIRVLRVELDLRDREPRSLSEYSANLSWRKNRGGG